MIPTDVKPGVKQQEIKELAAVSYNFLQEPPLKLEIKCKTSIYFLFDSGWYSTQLDIVQEYEPRIKNHEP